MPYLSEKKNLPLSLDRRVKLSEEDRKKIIALKGSMSQRECWKLFNISRSTVQYLWNPARLLQIKAWYAERRKDGRYYDREKHKEAMKSTRRWKQENKENLLDHKPIAVNVEDIISQQIF